MKKKWIDLRENPVSSRLGKIINMKIENKFPTKDISLEDLKSKFPLVAKNSKHVSKFEIAGVEFGGDLIPIFAGPNMVESRELIFDAVQNVKKTELIF